MLAVCAIHNLPARRNGGADGGLLELALVAEEAGRRLAPIPVAETAAAARLLGRLGETDLVAAAHLVGEERLKQRPAELLHRPLVRRGDAALRSADDVRVQQRDVEVLQAVFELQLAEGEAHRAARLAGWRTEDRDRVSAPAADADLQLEIEVLATIDTTHQIR